MRKSLPRGAVATFWVCCIACGAGRPARAADAPPARPVPALARQVRAILSRLASGDYKDRERATLEAEALPAAALPLIEDALASGALSPEVALRLADKVSALQRKVASTKYEDMLRGMYLWDRQSLLDAYDRGGHADPKWDAAAHEAIVLHVRPRRDPNISPKDQRRIIDAFKKAIDLGCDDPLLLYHYWQRKLTSEKPVPGVNVLTKIEPIRKACEGVVAGNYPPVHRMEAAMRLAEESIMYHRYTPELGKRVNENIEIALAQVEPAIKAGAPRHLLMGMLAPIEKLVHTMERNKGTEGHARMMKAVRVSAKGTAIPAFLDADFYIWRGYFLRNHPDYRTPGPKQEQVKTLLAEVVQQCKAAVDECLVAAPDDPDAINRMLRYLCMIAGPRAEFDKWFEKTTTIYPNDLPAYQVKLGYIRENGTAEEQLAFGRECLAKGNWPSRIPLILVDVHATLASDSGDPQVWEDLTAAFEGYLKRFPDAHRDRTAYLVSACLGNHWLVAKAQFDKLGDDLVWNLFDSQARIDECRRKANEAAAAAATPRS
jgi:hypothetical protein